MGGRANRVRVDAAGEGGSDCCSALVQPRKASVAIRAVLFMFNISDGVVSALPATNYRRGGLCLHLTGT